MLVTLTEAMAPLPDRRQALAAFNVFGYEDAAAIIAAAEELDVPVALMANKLALSHMPVAVIGALLCEMARRARVPVVVHLDHATDFVTVMQAVTAGFTSVMFDGSQLPLAQNIAQTREVCRAAHACGVSVEAEVGSVGYADGTAAHAERTTPEIAAAFEAETAPDALAISVGTVHRMTEGVARIDFALMDKVVATLRTPAVIHGASGVSDEDLHRLVVHGARKINIGTALRVAFGRVLRAEMEAHPGEFDRLKFYGPCMRAVTAMAREKILAMNAG
ncbi:MAG: fructose-bisphosphate aldolase [Telmatospirillum sp.]|nr:fructose-bisphosphate aldolase [Telmatospirillum sp.]